MLAIVFEAFIAVLICYCCYVGLRFYVSYILTLSGVLVWINVFVARLDGQNLLYRHCLVYFKSLWTINAMKLDIIVLHVICSE